MRAALAAAVAALCLSAMAAGAAAEGRAAKHRCLWGNVAAVAEAAKDRCGTLRLKSLSKDVIFIVRNTKEFARCFAKRQREMSAVEVAQVCSAAEAANDADGEAVFERVAAVETLTSQSTLADWELATPAAKATVLNRMGAFLAEKTGRSPGDIERSLLACLDAFAAGDASDMPAASAAVNRSVKVPEAAALCTLAR